MRIWNVRDGVNPKPSGGLLEYGTIVDEFVKENGDMKVQPKYVSYKEFSNLIECEKEKARSLNEDLRTDVSNTIKEIAMSKTMSHKEYVINDIESTKELSNFINSEKEKAKMQYEKIAGSYSSRAKIIKDDVLFPNIEKVHFNGPCTVVIWDDGTKTVVRCQDGDEFDCEKGLAMAIAKKALGNKGSYFDEFKKHISISPSKVVEEHIGSWCSLFQFATIQETISKLEETISLLKKEVEEHD